MNPRTVKIIVGGIFAISLGAFIYNRVKASKLAKEAPVKPPPGDPAFLPPRNKFPLNRGAKGYEVQLLQAHLLLSNETNKQLPGITSMDGIWGKDVERGIRGEDLPSMEITEDYYRSFIAPNKEKLEKIIKQKRG